MALTERLRLILDLDGKTFSSSLKGIRTDMAAVDGLFGKAKVGVKGLGGAFKEAAKNPAVMGTAIVGAGAAAFAAVDKFADLALEVGRISEATGISTEAISRMLEVTGDIGIEAGVVEKSLGFMNKTLGTTPAAFDKLGVAVKYADDGTVDANETFLSVVDTLNGIKDPAAKASAATKLLGKGWKDMAELIGQGSTELRASLAAVDGAKVIDAGEVEKAREYREAMDGLKDKFEELAINVGERLVPALTKAVELVTVLTDAGDMLGAAFGDQRDGVDGTIKSLDGTLTNVNGTMVAVTSTAIQLADSVSETAREARRLDEAMDIAPTMNAASDAMEHAGVNAQDFADAAANLADATDDANDALHASIREHEAAAAAADENRQAVEDLYASQRALADGVLDFEEATDRAEDAISKYNDTAKDSSSSMEDIDDESRSAAQAIIAQSEAYATLEGDALDSANGTQRQIDGLTLLSSTLSGPLKARLDAYIALLKSIPKTVTTTVRVVDSGAPGTHHDSTERFRGRVETMGNSVPGFSAGSAANWFTSAASEQETSEIELARRRYERGRMSYEDYVAFLEAERAKHEEFSDEEQQLYEMIAAAKAEEAARFEESERRKQEALEESIRKLKEYEEALLAAADNAADLAEATREQATAQAEFDASVAEYNRLVADPRSKPEERAAALRKVAEAQKKLDEATIAGAKAAAENAGLRPGTVDYANFVSGALRDYAAGHGDPTGALEAEATRFTTGRSGTSSGGYGTLPMGGFPSADAIGAAVAAALDARSVSVLTLTGVQNDLLRGRT